jgi:hypothetical protein
MSFLGFNPSVTQGNLNRIATHVVVPNFPQLAASAGYMGKGQAHVSIEGPFVNQIETATGIVNSPKPFVMGQIVISLLRSQSLANAWILQAQSASYIGPVIAYSDSSVFASITLTQCSIIDFDPGPYDGSSPETSVTIKGTFYINSTMWATLTGASGLLAAIT